MLDIVLLVSLLLLFGGYISSAVFVSYRPTEEEWQIKSELLDTQIAKNQANIEALHLEIFQGVPRDREELFELLTSQVNRPGRWEMTTEAFHHIRKLKEANGAYLMVPGVYHDENWYLLGKPIQIVPGSPLRLVEDDDTSRSTSMGNSERVPAIGGETRPVAEGSYRSI